MIYMYITLDFETIELLLISATIMQSLIVETELVSLGET